MTYTWFICDGRIYAEGVTVESDNSEDAADALIQKLKSERSEFLYTVKDLECLAEDCEMNVDDYITNYDYKKIDTEGRYYAKLKGLVYDNQLFLY